MAANSRMVDPKLDVQSSKSGILCKYYMNGACVKGEQCPFSHNLQQLPNTVCTHWLKGYCAFGEKCRYDHVRPEWAPRKADRNEGYEVPIAVRKPDIDNLETILPLSELTLSGRSRAKVVPNVEQIEKNTSSIPIDLPVDPFGSGEETEATEVSNCLVGREEYESYPQSGSSSVADMLGMSSSLGTSPSYNAWNVSSAGYEDGWSTIHDLGGQNAIGSICYEFYRSGSCSKGEACKLVHGDFCSICESYALNSLDSEDAAKHVVECKARHDRIISRARSASVECCICYERVLEKPGGAKKFGLLSCEHPFCLTCIRNWRNNISGSVDVESAVRTCPICRTTTHYITPSTVWPKNEEEKKSILAGYKAKLASIDCKHFSFGGGTCPFGSSCMYRHAYPDGREEQPVSRRVTVDEGEVKYVQPVMLSDFLVISQGKVGRRRR